METDKTNKQTLLEDLEELKKKIKNLGSRRGEWAEGIEEKKTQTKYTKEKSTFFSTSFGQEIYLPDYSLMHSGDFHFPTPVFTLCFPSIVHKGQHGQSRKLEKNKRRKELSCRVDYVPYGFDHNDYVDRKIRNEERLQEQYFQVIDTTTLLGEDLVELILNYLDFQKLTRNIE